MIDQYREMTEFYDETVQDSKSYEEIAKDLVEIIGVRRDILEVGIGTGLVAEHLIQIQPSYKITGIDTSESLLEQAKDRLGEKVILHHQDVSQLNLPKKFDVIYSRGGAWMFITKGSETMLASHLLNLDDIQRSFECVAGHLRKNGLFIISSSPANSNLGASLEGGLSYQRIATTESDGDAHYLRLAYLYRKSENIIRQPTIKLRLLDQKTSKKMMEEAGLGVKSAFHNKFQMYQLH